MIRIGSLFAGIGGFETSIERAIPNAHTIWQVEQNTFCQSILRKHYQTPQFTMMYAPLVHTIYNPLISLSAGIHTNRPA